MRASTDVKGLRPPASSPVVCRSFFFSLLTVVQVSVGRKYVVPAFLFDRILFYFFNCHP